MAPRSATVRSDGARTWAHKGTPARVDDILETACDLLIRDGYAKFSLRRVAATVGVGLATIQYHFSNRESLLSAAILRVMATWGSEFTGILEDQSRSVEDRLNALHDRGLRYIEETNTTPLLFELFAAAQHEPYLLQIVRDAYQVLRQLVAAVLREVRPDLSEGELLAFATLVPAMMEGLNLYMQVDDPARPDSALIRHVLRGEISGVLTALESYRPQPVSELTPLSQPGATGRRVKAGVKAR